ncbi:hypothetical protein B0T14DRAFT_264219 [Immersiella caudata]|uniref:Uncharacterized protein n=1 Tax=Immersiella caudata TaxID=314043 RepID=A0AA40BXK2_9PEZI|nr:hypothetical protein B0T14DRAFT_264219 [Immersiella caudata]
MREGTGRSLPSSFSSSRTRKTLSTRRAVKAKDDVNAFDALFTAVSDILKNKRLKGALKSEEATMVCWSLHKRGYPFAAKLSRWVLPVPEKPIFFPAERIEQVLYNLVSVQQKRKDPAHTCCGGGAVLGCIENQLYSQKLAYEKLSNNLSDLTSLERDPTMAHSLRMRAVIAQNIAALEAVDMSLTTLVSFFEENIGRAAPVGGKWKFVQKIKRFIKGPYGAVAIKDKEVEELKRKARNELSSLQRTSPILAAHIRLRDSSKKDELQRVCDRAEVGPEKSEMALKLAIVPGNLYNAQSQAAQLKRVRGHYDDTYNKLIANVEALNKAVGGEYAKKGDKLFNIRGKLGRFGRKKKNHKRGCGVEDEATAEWKGGEKVHIKELGDSSDCESWCEKMEPKWMV